MEFEIKKEGNEKYLYAKNIKFDDSDYRIQMILNNNIKGLLPLKIRNVNNEKELLYDITGMSSLSSIFERSLIKKDDLKKLVLEIKRLEETLKEYLLCGDNIKFDLNSIYYKAKEKQYYFVYTPIEVDDYNLQMKALFNQVLDYVNYNDREAVALAYGMQEIASRDDFTLDELLELALGSTETEIPVALEEKIEEFDEEDFEEEEVKETLIEKFKKIFHKDKHKEPEEEYDNEDNYYIEETNNDFSFDTDNLSDEDATVLLSSIAADHIVLKSTNREPPIMVAPNKYPFVIGKSKRSSDFRVSSNVVSRVHARINYEMGEFSIEDLNSTNGTFVNDERLKPHEIKTIERGDVIKLADIEFSVE